MASLEWWHNRLVNSSLLTAGKGSDIDLLEEKIVPNSRRDRQDIRVKYFIHIELAC